MTTSGWCPRGTRPTVTARSRGEPGGHHAAGFDADVFEGTARVFYREQSAMDAVLGGELREGDVVVIRYEGPKSDRFADDSYRWDQVGDGGELSDHQGQTSLDHYGVRNHTGWYLFLRP